MKFYDELDARGNYNIIPYQVMHNAWHQYNDLKG